MIVSMFVAVRIGCGRPALRMLAIVIDDNGNGRKGTRSQGSTIAGARS
jgi:hypothetical protein